MKKYCAALFVVALLAALALPAAAQGASSAEVKEKPRLYTYVALWSLPRAQWADWAKEQAGDEKTLQDAVAKGTLVGYGDDANLVHQPDSPTHDDWWQSMSLAGLMSVLDQFYKSGATTTGTQMNATKHWDNIYVSRYYNWKPGTIKDGYGYGSSYKLKPDAPDDTIDTLAKTAIVPLMEKMLSSGVIQQYEIDTEAVHTDSPGTFYLFWTASNADALDKVQASLRDALKANPLIGSAFDSAVDFKNHRDFLSRSNATWK
jgi:hypothetical protein